MARSAWMMRDTWRNEYLGWISGIVQVHVKGVSLKEFASLAPYSGEKTSLRVFKVYDGHEIVQYRHIERCWITFENLIVFNQEHYPDMLRDTAWVRRRIIIVGWWEGCP